MDNRRFNSLRTRLNVIYVLLVLVLAHQVFWPALLLVALGEGIRTWSAGLIRKNSALTAGGPYRFTRNPLYLGSTISSLGLALAIQNYWLLLVLVLVFLPVYQGMIKREERELMGLFGDEYRHYLEAVPRYLGWPHSLPGAEPARFSWRLVCENGEHKTWLALLGVVVVLYGRVHWPVLASMLQHAAPHAR